MFTTTEEEAPPPTVRACPAARARLDADKTAKPLTRIITHTVPDSDGMCVCLSSRPLVDPQLVLQDGTRIPIGS